MATSPETMELVRRFYPALKDPVNNPETSFPVKSGYEISMDLTRLVPEIGKLNIFAHMSKLGRCFTVDAPTIGLRRSVVPGMYPAEDPLFGPLQGFARILEGNEIEVNTTSMEDDVSIAPAHYWNWGIWKTGMVEVIYRGEIYPQVTEAIKQRINRLPNGQQVIVDLFGGDGEFVEELHQSALFPENSGQFHVVDSNEPSLNKARQRFAQTEVGVHSQDLTGPEDIFSGIRGKPTVVTAIGGLCTSIVTRVQGLEIARKIYEGMADGGFFIATGYTAMILNGRDFSGIGFEVEQMSIPGNVFTFRTPDQLYVLRKPAAEN